jgi:hypothetical protein
MINYIHCYLPILILTLSACSEVAKNNTAPSADETSSIAPTTPRVVNMTPFPSLLLIGDDAAGHYYSLVTKATFSIREDGALQLLSTGEALVTQDPDPKNERDCEATGAAINQITTWFPYTGIFVDGGKLEKVKTTSGAKMPLRALVDDGSGVMQYRGPRARKPEYYYAPCIGERRVNAGWRLDDYLPLDARIYVTPINGNPIGLTPPQPFVPFVLLRYHSGAMIPVPMRIVLATIDLLENRVVLQYQSTFATTPALRKIELRGIWSEGKPSSGETAKRYAQRTQATLDDLAQCAPPRDLAIEPCATASRHPNPLIFSNSDASISR